MNYLKSRQPLITRALRLLRNAQPFGLALLMYLLVQAAVGSIAMMLSSTQIFATYYFSEIPSEFEPFLIRSKENPGTVPGPFPGCEWLPADQADQESIGEISMNPVIALRCSDYEEQPADYAATANPLGREKRFDEDDGWRLEQRIITAKSARDKLIPNWLLIVPFLFSIYLLKSLDLSGDVKRGWAAIKRSPWILVVLPLATISVSALVSVAWSPDVVELEEIEEILSFVVPSAIGTLVVFPLLEEALFRHWIYVRTIHLMKPVWVAVGSAWTFTLAHLFNPQVGSLSGYLPTVFVAGCILFWLRHRYRSLSVSFAAHAANNGVVIAVLSMS
jgi:membrane protease YdiL (CAAX protease family)